MQKVMQKRCRGYIKGSCVGSQHISIYMHETQGVVHECNTEAAWKVEGLMHLALAAVCCQVCDGNQPLAQLCRSIPPLASTYRETFDLSRHSCNNMAHKLA